MCRARILHAVTAAASFDSPDLVSWDSWVKRVCRFLAVVIASFETYSCSLPPVETWIETIARSAVRVILLVPCTTIVKVFSLPSAVFELAVRPNIVNKIRNKVAGI
jgi:hypothetical protein